MRKAITYTIVKKRNTLDLMDEVNQLIANNWEPTGGITSIYNEYTKERWFYQPMVQYKEQPTTVQLKPIKNTQRVRR